MQLSYSAGGLGNLAVVDQALLQLLVRKSYKR